MLKGSASVLYGQVQPGGIVNAVSKRPKKEALNEAGIEVGSFGLRTLQADVNRPGSSAPGESPVHCCHPGGTTACGVPHGPPPGP